MFSTNKVKNPTALNQNKIGENISILEESIKTLTIVKILRIYGISMLFILTTIFLIIVTVRLALQIF